MSKDKILVIEDSEEFIDIIVNLFQEKYDLFVAEDGESGIEIALEQQPDIILLDLMLPVFSGYEVCEKLKTFDSTKDIPIIFITSRTDSESIVQGFEAGGVDYIPKPFEIRELTARVENHIELKKSHDKIKEYLNILEEKNRKLNHAMEQLRRLSLTDTLTELLNRAS